MSNFQQPTVGTYDVAVELLRKDGTNAQTYTIDNVDPKSRFMVLAFYNSTSGATGLITVTGDDSGIEYYRYTHTPGDFLHMHVLDWFAIYPELDSSYTVSITPDTDPIPSWSLLVSGLVNAPTTMLEANANDLVPYPVSTTPARRAHLTVQGQVGSSSNVLIIPAPAVATSRVIIYSVTISMLAGGTGHRAGFTLAPPGFVTWLVLGVGPAGSAGQTWAQGLDLGANISIYVNGDGATPIDFEVSYDIEPA